METPVALEDLTKLLTVDQAWHYRIIPASKQEDTLTLLCDRPTDMNLRDELELILGSCIVLQSISSDDLVEQLNRLYPKTQSDKIAPSPSFSLNDHAAIEKLITEARSLNSSDIHIETYSEKCRIRFRVDGVLIDRHRIPKNQYSVLINKIKIAASCDIGEKRLPQDGRIRIKSNEKNIDIRVSILPTLYGEKIVMRILGSDASNISITNLGLSPDEAKRFATSIIKPNGIVLISGPTGSGKTTTLYATIKELNDSTRNILTIEDPIEYTLDGINQVQLKEDIGLTYAETLRTFLRQDPDVIMLGEIRDAATAQMAIRAALTGHLVLSTIHTNSAWGTVTRLIEMGIPSYLIASTLNLTVAQRLVRKLCKKCASKCEQEKLSDIPINIQNKLSAYQFKAVGCADCYYTGYKGRKAIYEVINITNDLTEVIKTNISDISTYLKENKIASLQENAIDLVNSAETSVSEVLPYLLIDSK